MSHHRREPVVLISSAGRRVALLDIFRRVIDACGGGRVLTADTSAESAASWASAQRHFVPPCDDPNFIPTMVDLCAREQVSLLVPTIDTELTAYARHRQEFRAVGTLVAISDPRTIRIAADKCTTHDFLVANGFPTVNQAEATEVLDMPPRWPYPLVVKPVRGSGSKGVCFVRNSRELMVATAEQDVVVQQMAPGAEFTVDVFVDPDGVCRGVVPRERIEVRGGEVVKARTERIGPVIGLVEKLVSALPDAFGVLNVQTFFDQHTDEMNVIEINPRFGGGFPLADRAGAPFARWLVEMSVGCDPHYDVPPWESGLVMLRYDEAVYVDEGRLNRSCAR